MPSQLIEQSSAHFPLPQINEVSFAHVIMSIIKGWYVLTGRFCRQADLFSFHETHFGEAAIAAFANDFLEPKQAPTCDPNVGTEDDEEYYYYEEEEEDDDGLGYYPDGVKRTLTDEQIAMFRHSELQALERARERNPRRRNSSSPLPLGKSEPEPGESEDGEVIDVELPRNAGGGKKKKKNKKKKRGSGNGNNKRWEPDIDRRKRTWDVVEQGLDRLDYDEMEQSGASTEHVARRRRIKYDDDDDDG